VNLLIISYNPARPSFRQRISCYLDILRTNGINCEVVHYPRGSLARYQVIRKAAEFDAVYLQKKTLNVLDAMWFRRYAKNVIFDFDDAVMYDNKYPERRPSRRKHTKPFERTVKLAKMVIAGNSYLAEHARRFNPNVQILPTGLDTSAYKLETSPKDDGKVRLVWIGSHSTLGYLEQIKPALEEIGSRFDNVVLRIICDEFIHIRNINVEKCTWSEQTQIRDLVTSDIGLAPLPDNRFTKGKCGFKILQYSSACLPVIASPVGVNVDYIKEGINGFLAEGRLDWIEKISRLLKEPELRKKMGIAGSKEVQRFDFKVLGEELVKLIKRCVEN
jgi:glycosyltransferase involved in cell wall biosynthesis